MNLMTAVTVIIFSMFSIVRSEKGLQLEQNILTDIFSRYDRRVRPFGDNGTGPVVVEVNMYVRSMNEIDDVKMTYATQLTFRQKWRDERLQYESHGLEYVTLTSPDRMWTPDLFFSNEMKGHFHKILTPNNLIRIYPDGNVLYSTRISLELSCPMDLANYPMDKQTCSILAASYGYTTRDIVFVWKKEDPVQVSSRIYLPKFSIQGFMTDYCTSKTNTGEYSCIKLNFDFLRDFTFYLIQAYMPSMLLVILSWVTFWMNPRSIAVRLGVWIGVLLSMIIVTTSVSERGPQVSYIRAIDVWLGTCICFIFCVLIEMVFVNNATSREDGQKIAMDEQNAMGIEDGKAKRLHSYSSTPLRWLNKYSTQGQRIDAISRFVFPIAFGFFNFVYWITYIPK